MREQVQFTLYHEYFDLEHDWRLLCCYLDAIFPIWDGASSMLLWCHLILASHGARCFCLCACFCTAVDLPGTHNQRSQKQIHMQQHNIIIIYFTTQTIFIFWIRPKDR
jgi:hypothetical protein